MQASSTGPAIPLFKVFMPDAAHAALKPVLESGRLACGPQVAKFEAELARWFAVPEVVALNDSSGALMLALYLAGVRPDDEVIVASLACSATVMPIANLFARPIWCDVDPSTGMPATEQIAPLISSRTRAILIYHWSGDVADMDGIMTLADKHGIKVIEEASEAFGAEYKQQRLGGRADFSIYSFYATKHLNTGEGAVLLAANPADIQAARRLRRFGIDAGALRLANGDLNTQSDIPLSGFNLQMGEIAATLGLVAMPYAEHIVATHRANGLYYETALAKIAGLRQLKRNPDAVSAYWTFSMLADQRDALIRKLTSQGIGAQRLHVRNDGFTCFGGVLHQLPGTAEFDAHNISIPCGWWLGDEARHRVVQCIAEGW